MIDIDWIKTGFGFLAGAALGLPVMHWGIRHAERFGWLDRPKARGHSQRTVPIIGSVLSIFSFVLLMGAGFLAPSLLWVIGAAGFALVTSHADDRLDIRAGIKLGLQLLTAIAVVSPVVGPVHSSSEILSWALGVFFIIGAMNGLNLIDGINGFFGTVMTLAFTGLVFFSPDPMIQAIAAVHAGLLASFLYLNLFRDAGFIGNAGSYYFGFLWASLFLHSAPGSHLVISQVWLGALMLVVAVTDTLLVSILRLARGVSPLMPDKEHLHFKFLRAGFRPLVFLAIVAVWSIVGNVTAVLLASSAMGDLNRWLLAAGVLVALVASLGAWAVLVDWLSNRTALTWVGHVLREKELAVLRIDLTPKLGVRIDSRDLRRMQANIRAVLRINDACVILSSKEILLLLGGNAAQSDNLVPLLSERLQNILAKETKLANWRCEVDRLRMELARQNRRSA